MGSCVISKNSECHSHLPTSIPETASLLGLVSASVSVSKIDKLSGWHLKYTTDFTLCLQIQKEIIQHICKQSDVEFQTLAFLLFLCLGSFCYFALDYAPPLLPLPQSSQFPHSEKQNPSFLMWNSFNWLLPCLAWPKHEGLPSL